MGNGRDGGHDTGETTDERENRELIELLNELRVVLPGVQVTLAVLLTVPFTDRFEALHGIQLATYVLAVFSTTLGAILLMTPTAFHRIRFRKGDKEALLRTANRFSLAGLVCLGVSLTSVIGLVSALALSPASAVVAAALTAVLIVSLWFAIPIWRQLRGR